MSDTIRREILIPQPREQVWRALTDPAALEQWMYPNDIEPRVGHRFTFRVPANPKLKFDGIIVQCEVIECEPPTRLAYLWSGGAMVNTRVTYVLEPDGEGTRMIFEHSGFDLAQPWCKGAMKGLEYGYGLMFGKLPGVVAGLAERGEQH